MKQSRRQLELLERAHKVARNIERHEDPDDHWTYRVLACREGEYWTIYSDAYDEEIVADLGDAVLAVRHGGAWSFPELRDDAARLRRRLRCLLVGEVKPWADRIHQPKGEN